MKYFTLFSFLFLGLMGTTCLRPTDDKYEMLYGKTWLHSTEEDQDDIKVYRPNTYQFPPSRGRTGFSIEKDGTFRSFAIAPTDGLEEHPGNWKKVTQNILRVTFPAGQDKPFDLELVSVSDDLLKVRRKAGK